MSVPSTGPGTAPIDVLDEAVPVDLVPSVAALQAELAELRQHSTRLGEALATARTRVANVLHYLDTVVDDTPLAVVRRDVRMLIAPQPQS